ncbi:MAG: hypothetical protein KDK78_08810, partial [Chlamydiia bacterium]|nr:hypothetical protein [Chlamydiia bacterium]
MQGVLPHRADDDRLGFFVSFVEEPKRALVPYIERLVQEIHQIQIHPIFQNLPMCSATPCTAVVVGTGTVGLQAVVFATRTLPPGSTILIVQRGLDCPEELERLLSRTIEGGDAYRFVASPPINIGQLDRLEAFLDGHADACQSTRLFIHTADKAQRYIPDDLPVMDVLAQLVQRQSPTVISDKLDRLSSAVSPIIKILISSECAQNRSDYRIPNLGPYQIGKVIGDEVFRCHNADNERALSIIAYSGPMSTLGQSA